MQVHVTGALLRTLVAYLERERFRLIAKQDDPIFLEIFKARHTNIPHSRSVSLSQKLISRM